MEIPVGIMADLQGPRIRISVENEVAIGKGEKVVVSDVSQPLKPQTSNLKSFQLDYPGIIKDIEVGNVILIEDGLKSIKVVKKENDYLEAEVIDGGIIKNHKGVNIPDAKLNIPSITEKDERDLEFSLKNEVDFVAMSFVSSAADVSNLRSKITKILGRDNNLPQIVVKIERKEAIKNLDEIIAATDAVMVARGDLGIEMDETKVVIFQKEIISKSLSSLKPVIVATEMLSSMMENPRPTRAEVSDVTNAVIDHADAVMLSGESANGKYPVETIQTMAEIITNTEESPYDDICNFNIQQEFSNEYVNFIKIPAVCSLIQMPRQWLFSVGEDLQPGSFLISGLSK
jgi:pyruvate kinase